MLTELTNLDGREPSSLFRQGTQPLKAPTTHVTVTKKTVGEAASDKLAAEAGAKEGRTGTPTSAKGKPFNQPSFSNFLYIPDTTGLLKLVQKRRREHTAREQRKSSTIFLNIQSSPQSHRHLRYELGMGQEGHSSATSHHGDVCISTV